MNVLIINAGSSSLKYQLMDPESGEVSAKGLCERIYIDGRLTHKVGDKKVVKDIPMPGDVILVCITRDAEFIIPHGNTTLLPWDRILCLTQDDTLHLLMDAWGLSGK